MGLIKTTISSKNAIKCDLDSNTVIKKIIINDLDTIIVNKDECAIILDNGVVVDAAIEEGIYKYNTDSEPLYLDYSISFIQAIKNIFKNEVSSSRVVLFINLSKISNKDFKYEDIDYNNKKIKVYGELTFKISNPFKLINKYPLYDEVTCNQIFEFINMDAKILFEDELNNQKIDLTYLPISDLTVNKEIKEFGIEICSYDIETITID